MVSWIEAINSEQHNNWIATATMAGRTLESIVRDHYSNITNFWEGLKRLHKDGIISEEMSSWSKGIWALRNIGAHPYSRDIEKDDAVEVMNFTELILEIIYKFRPRFSRIKKKLNS